MSELLPYEDELSKQLNDLPMPDENMAWADMKRRLDEDDDDPIIPIWLRGCLLWGFIGIALVTAGWFFISKHNQHIDTSNTSVIVNKTNGQINTNSTNADNRSVKQSTEQTSLSQDPITNTVVSSISSSLKIKGSIANGDADSTAIKRVPQTTFDDPQATASTISSQRRSTVKIMNTITNGETTGTISTTTKTGKKNKIVSSVINKRKSIIHKNSNGDITDIATYNSNKQGKKIMGSDPSNDHTDIIMEEDTTIVRDLPLIDTNKKMSVIDIANKHIDTIHHKNKIPTDTTVKSKNDSTKKNKLFFSAGIAMNQQIPIAGQQTVSYGSQGRKGTLADHIPSIYFRVNKENKWFIQTEFRYGAPQYTNDIIYKQLTDSGASSLPFSNDTSFHLKKTYYHQLPITLNYFVTKHLSLGVGLIWNKFVSAVSEQSITQHDNFTNTDTIISKGVIINTQKADSNFVSSYWQSVVEANYQWKRFSFGARYTFGLEPFLRFTLPGGVVQEEKNQSILLFVRYELWRSKEKNTNKK